MNKTGFIVNGRKSIVRRFQKSFDRYSKLIDGEYNVLMTSEQGHAKRLAKELANDGYSHIVAVGGDGTLHEVINGLLNSNNTECIVGLLPLGTANDYAKSIGTTNDLKLLIGKVNKGLSKKVNIGLVCLDNGLNEYFINIADMGLGVDVVQRVNGSRKWFGANLTFSKAILQSFLSYKNQEITVKTDSWLWEGKMNSLVVANGKFFGSGMCIAPDADQEGEFFSVVIIGDVRMRDYIRYTGQIKKGQKIDHPEVHYHEAKVLEIHSRGSGIEADGEFIGLEPKKIELLKGRANFLA